jgi:DNA-binding MarR family transcriptional regulator
MVHKIARADYRALAEFRYRIRLFLNASDEAARSVNLEPEQYQLLLAVRGMPSGREVTIQAVAEQLCVRHNTVVERVDRLVKAGLLSRRHGSSDGRVVFVELRARGEELLERLARRRLSELRQSGPELVRALSRVIAVTGRATHAG